MSLAEPRERKSHLWARDEYDFYIEPTWCSARLFDVENFSHHGIADPACGIGRIVENAIAKGIPAVGCDIVRRRPEFGVRDFFSLHWRYGNIVSNPPFKDADRFALHALETATHKVVLLLPATWHLGDERSRWLETTPLRRIWNLTPRPSMPPGAVIEAGEKPGGGTKDFAWFVWLQGYDGHPETRWLHRDAPAIMRKSKGGLSGRQA